MSTILSILSLLSPVVLWLLDLFKADKAKREAFIKFVQSAKDDGIISVEAKDEFARQDAALKQPPAEPTVKPDSLGKQIQP